MKVTHKTFLKTGGIAYMLVGIGHFTGTVLLRSSPQMEAYKQRLAECTFELFGTQNLLQFHVGFSLTMTALFVFLGLLCLMITADKKVLLTLCLGSLAVAGIVLKYFVIVPQVITGIALIAFILSYLQYSKGN